MHFRYYMTVVLSDDGGVVYTFDNGDDFLRVLRRELRKGHLISGIRRVVVE